ncbi:FIMAH domain-containing protein [Bacillus niameyensis]|uniref:FIMAH domain-containing protein n=1 Tax=Bacillus niameyensis TaxID=1522308 RepID=UPI00078586B9|nr:lamin tail domain-containing protein [Bacillus niameyensis]
MNKVAYLRILSAIMIILLVFPTSALHSLANSHQEVNKSVPPLLITEIVPDSTDIGNADGFEFIEIYNNTNQVLNFQDYQIIYRYPVGPENDLYWIPKTRDVDINPKETLVLWIENADNLNSTVEDFNANYGSNLIEDVNIVKMPGGMSNQRMRDILIRTNTGEEIVMAQYNKATWDVQENMGIFYQYPQDGSNEMVKVSAGEKAATPGIAEPELVPVEPIDLDPNLTPTIENKTPSSQPLDRVEIIASGKDDFLLSSMTLYYKDVNATEFNTLSLQLNPEDGLYHHTVPVQDVLKTDELEYYLEASNGLNIAKTDIFKMQITEATSTDIPPLLITEVVPDSSNLNGANAYEYIEVFNNTDQPINFGNYHILYRYPSGSHAVWFEGLDHITIQPGKAFVLWVDNGKNLEATVDDFNTNYGTDLIENIDIVKAPAGGGMANTAERDLVIATKTGEEIVSAGYYKGEKDVFKNMGIFYHFPIGSNQMIHYKFGEPATPGTAESELIPSERVVVNPNTRPSITNKTKEKMAKPGESVVLLADAQDDFLVTNMKVFYKQAQDQEYQSITLTKNGQDGLFHHPVILSEDSHAGNLEYYFVASNGFGETESEHFQVTLEVENKPDKPELQAPETGASDIETQAELSVKASNREGGKLDVHFYQGWSTNTSKQEQIKVFYGAADIEPPSSRVPDGEEELTEEEYLKLRAINNEKITTESEEQFPYHRFEVTLDKEALSADQVELKWHGSSLEGRKVSMYAWDYEAVQWILVDKHIAKTEEGFSLIGEVAVSNFTRDGMVNILVQDEIPPRDEYDYTFVWLSDTQFYTEVFPELYESQVDWIVQNKEEMDIKYVFHTGDIVNTYNQMYQWEFADQYMQRLEDANIPYGVLAGNHDVQLQPEIDYANYYRYFGEDRFINQPYYGESYLNNRGHYDLISSHGTDFIMIYMGWQPTTEGIAWMNEVLAQYPDRFAILNFHEYLLANGQRSNIAERVYQEVILPNENVKMVLGGHYHGSIHQTRMMAEADENLVRVATERIDDTGDGKPDRVVHQLLGNFQDAHRGGDGYMNVMNIDVSNNMIYVNTYSPELDSYDLFPPYTLELDLTPKKKSVSTDFFEVNVYTEKEIGTVNNVENGDDATLLWENLNPDQTYYWFTTVQNEAGEVAVSDMWHFTTAKAEDEIVEISLIRSLVDEYIQSGEIEGPLTNQLANTARQAEHHYQKGNKKQANKFLDKFIETLNKKQMQKHISPEAKATLVQKTNQLLEKWQKL